jgi:hypothetical protein
MPGILYQDGKNTRHASFITVVVDNSALKTFVATTFILSATQTPHIAGPLVVMLRCGTKLFSYQICTVTYQ